MSLDCGDTCKEKPQLTRRTFSLWGDKPLHHPDLMPDFAFYCFSLQTWTTTLHLSAKSLSAGKLDFPSMIAKTSLNIKKYYYIIIIISEAQPLYALVIY